MSMYNICLIHLADVFRVDAGSALMVELASLLSDWCRSLCSKSMQVLCERYQCAFFHIILFDTVWYRDSCRSCNKSRIISNVHTKRE
jgi:hypothetical protein